MTLGQTLPEGTTCVTDVHLGVLCSSAPELVPGFLNGGVVVLHHDVGIPHFLDISLKTEACPHVCGEVLPSGLRDRGADDGVQARHDSRICAIMKSSWPVSL